MFVKILSKVKKLFLFQGNSKMAKNEKGKLIPPDGGWGWMIVLGISLVNVSFLEKIFFAIISITV